MSERLISGSEALVFFYAVFWALIFGPANRFRAFDTQLLFTRRWRQLSLRMLVAVIVVNVAPLAWFMFLYEHVVPHSDAYRSVLAAGIASLALPGFPRFLHAVLLTDCFGCFYSRRERRDILAEWRKNRSDRVSRYFNAFFIPGVGYLTLATGAAEIALGRTIGWWMASSFLVPLLVWYWCPRELILGLTAGMAVITFVVALAIDQTNLKEMTMRVDWIALGTWVLAASTIWLAYSTRGLVEATKRGMREQNSIAQKESRLRILLQYEDRFDSLAASRGLLAAQLRSGGWAYEDIRDDIPNFFESLGALLHEGSLDLDMVWSFFSYYADHYHRALRRYIELDRQTNDDPTLWEEFDYLVEQLMSFEATKYQTTVEQVQLGVERHNERFLDGEAVLRR